MKVFNVAALALVVSALTACGTAEENMNVGEISQATIADDAAGEVDSDALNFSRDACSVKLPKATYTLARGGDVSIPYSFFKLSEGDRVRIVRISDKSIVWDSNQLPKASGKLSVPVRTLGRGEYRVHGFVNSIKTDEIADCGASVKLVIRDR